MTKTIIIVQARIGSTRLPGKVLKPVLGKPLLSYQIERLKHSKLAQDVVIATTRDVADQPIVTLCDQLHIPYYRGSEENVLSRYYEVAHEYQADVVVRSTADCPLIDPRVVDQVIEFYLNHSTQYDYVSNTLHRTFPRGMDTEVFSIKALDQSMQQAKKAPELEHVTLYIESHPERFRLGNVDYVKDESKHRWTVDTADDFSLISQLLTELYPRQPNFTLEDCLQCFDQHPEWYFINAHVQQKAV